MKPTQTRSGALRELRLAHAGDDPGRLRGELLVSSAGGRAGRVQPSARRDAKM